MHSVLRRPNLQAGVAMAAFGLLAWESAARAVAGSTMLVYALAGGLALALAIYRPRPALIVLLIVGATVLPDRAGQFAVGGVRSDLAEVGAFLLVGVWLLYLVSGSVAKPGFAGPWLVFYVAVGIAICVGAVHGTNPADLLGYVKAYAFYLLPVVFTSFFASATEQDFLERWLFRLCTAGSLLVLAAASTGFPLGAQRASTVETLDTAVSAQRIRTSLLSLLVVGVLLLVGQMASSRVTRRSVAQLSLYLLPIGLSFNRSTWIPLILGLVLLLLLRPGPRVRGRGLRAGLSLVVAGSILTVAASSGLLGRTPQAALDRAASTVDSSVLSERSYTDRQDEDRAASAAIRRSPVVGVGLGQPYGARRPVYLSSPPRIIFTERLFIHNTYLGIWLQVGLLGIVAILLLGASIARAVHDVVRVDRTQTDSTRRLAAGLAMFVFAASAILQTSLTHRPTILGMSCALALLQRPRLPPRLAPFRVPLTQVA
ncbi:MAG: hypothetical protein JWP11_1143 [Frankiales bacterium]|nr:hypothetical protein [Frankiales bacterium]